jgi:hypothetical protein
VWRVFRSAGATKGLHNDDGRPEAAVARFAPRRGGDAAAQQLPIVFLTGTAAPLSSVKVTVRSRFLSLQPTDSK